MKFWEINSELEFNEFAIKTFKHQIKKNLIYRSYCEMLKIKNIDHYSQIPYLPIQFFKTHKIKSFVKKEKYIFRSSSINSDSKSEHLIFDILNYKKSFYRCFNKFYGDPKKYIIIGLLPSYLERKDSSLIFMVDDLIKKTKNKFSGFYNNEFQKLLSTINNLKKQKKTTIIIGVSFALLDLIEFKKIKLTNTIIMETGGMKGRRKEIIRKDLHEKLKKGLGVSKIHSEYGMTELLSQAYSKKNGIFECPPWMKVSIRDTTDPLKILSKNSSGVINIIDLANQESCSFIATEDLGRLKSNNTFEVIGRLDESEIRGCNLMVY